MFLIKSISCQNLKAIWKTEITIRGQEEGFFLALVMKEGDKGLRTFYQTSFGESRAPAGSSELETQQEEMIQERQRLVGGQRLGAHCCYHRLPAPTGTLLQLYPVRTLPCSATVMFTLRADSLFKHCSICSHLSPGQRLLLRSVSTTIYGILLVYYNLGLDKTISTQGPLTYSEAILSTQH